jgi:hypothetical protein
LLIWEIVTNSYNAGSSKVTGERKESAKGECGNILEQARKKLRFENQKK